MGLDLFSTKLSHTLDIFVKCLEVQIWLWRLIVYEPERLEVEVNWLSSFSVEMPRVCNKAFLALSTSPALTIHHLL